MTSGQKVIKVLAICLAALIIGIIVNAILSLVGLFSTSKNLQDYVKSFNNINNVEIDLNVTNLEIVSGVQFKVEAHNVTKSFEVVEKNNTLYIKEKNGWFLNNYVKNNDSKVIVYIPQEINELKIDANTGNNTIKDIKANKLELDLGIGLVNINNSEFKESEIDGGTGEIEINNTVLNNLDLDTGIGEVNIRAQITGKSKIDTGIGKTNLTLMGNKDDYQFTIDKGIGELKIDNEKISSGKYGNGQNLIDFEIGIGAVNINFE